MLKQNVVFGVLFVATILSAASCAEVNVPEHNRAMCDVSTQCLGNAVQVCTNGLWSEPVPCTQSTCINGTCMGTCESDAKRCSGNTIQRCIDGDWTDESPCAFVCADGACAGECVPGVTQCIVDTNTVRACANGNWTDPTPCVNSTCLMGICTGVCEPGQKQCAGKTTQNCNAGSWTDGQMCPFVCDNGSCSGECIPGEKRCAGNNPQECDMKGFWQDAPPCTASAPRCEAGTCKTPPSCSALPSTCGPSSNESCCAVTAIPGGTFNRGNDAAYPATVGDFRLDRFEVTVGRFRKFVEAYPGNKPLPNAGAHPLIPGSGWQSSWDANLPADQNALVTNLKLCPPNLVWTDTVGPNENLPMNCFSWYEAVAFCAWEGGRLPTEAEWNYAAAGGSEQRAYPWSNPPNSTTIDQSYANYDCFGDGSLGCMITDILKVGSKSPKGDGRWGQADLGGSMWEWTMDKYNMIGLVYPTPCNNCSDMSDSPFRIVRGGSWHYSDFYALSSSRFQVTPDNRGTDFSVRCAGSL